jgi:hypothetical protein
VYKCQHISALPAGARRLEPVCHVQEADGVEHKERAQ